MNRRNFILLSATGISTLNLSGCFLGELKYDESLNKPQLLSKIWDANDITAIGKRYCRLFPDEKNKRKLVKLLSLQHSTVKSLEKIIIKDYQEGNTVMLEGWILSKTEARQCALFSLAQTKN